MGWLCDRLEGAGRMTLEELQAPDIDKYGIEEEEEKEDEKLQG